MKPCGNYYPRTHFLAHQRTATAATGAAIFPSLSEGCFYTIYVLKKSTIPSLIFSAACILDATAN